MGTRDYWKNYLCETDAAEIERNLKQTQALPLRQHQERLQTARWELDNRLSDRRVELADMETITTYVEDLRSLLNNSSITEKKSFIKSFVKEVRIREDEATLTYTIPLSARPTIGA